MIISSFQAKTGGERPRNSKKKKLSFRSVPTRPVIKNSKKIGKKFKKIKNMIISSFQAKISREGPRKSENKNYHSDLFLPDQL